MRIWLAATIVIAVFCASQNWIVHGASQTPPDDNNNIFVPEHFWLKPTWHPSLQGGVRFPTIKGTTDLPDGVTVVVVIKRSHLPDATQRIANGLPPCAVNCDPAEANGTPSPRAVVNNGNFAVGPFSFGGAAFLPGKYILEIYVPAGRSRSVGPISDREWVDRLMESFRTPVYRGTIEMP